MIDTDNHIKAHIEQSPDISVLDLTCNAMQCNADADAAQSSIINHQSSPISHLALALEPIFGYSLPPTYNPQPN